ncbi:hypothetical protein QYF61_006072 [Mycteria americana]|uniref:Uncharacterized protein n=1 Tax=Mycteria americana TaxID=33587 RepID=A0AAN7S640_MYCAM|nr:hypothetical protein QYF61_006072 [Mycteria americana]
MATAGRRARGGGEREQDVQDVESASEDARFWVPLDLTMYGQRSHKADLRKGLATTRETPRDHPPPPAPAQKIENFLEQEPLLKGRNKVSPQPSLLQVEQPQLSQPFFIPSSGPTLVHIFPELRTPELHAVLQVGSHQNRVEGQNHLPQPAGHASLDAAQDTVGLLGCECSLVAHGQLFIHQYPHILLCTAALNPFIPQPVLIPGVALTQVQGLALGLVEPHEVHMDPLLKLVKAPLDGLLSLSHVNCITQLGVICKLAEGALNPTVYVIDEDIKQYWSQYGHHSSLISIGTLSH